MDRLALARERSKLAGSPIPSFLNKQHAPQPRQLGPEQLVPALIQMGLKPELAIGNSEEHACVVFQVTLGPIVMPITFTAAQMRSAILPAAIAATDRIDPPTETAASTDPARDAELLEEATRALKGDYDDDDDDNELGYVLSAEASTDG
jgi:hypothetical protein